MIISKVITVKEKREKMIFTDRSSRLHNTDQSHGTGTTTTMDKSHWEENTQTRKQGITRSPARWGSGVERDEKCLLYSPPSASKNHPQGQNGPCHCPYQPVSCHAHCAEEIGGIQKRKCKLKPQTMNAYAYGEAQFEEVILYVVEGLYLGITAINVLLLSVWNGNKARRGITNPWDPHLRRRVVLSAGRACCSLFRPRWCRRCMWLHYCTPENKG